MDEATARRSAWPLWGAIFWIVFLFLFLPSIYVGRSPADGAFLGFKVVTTIISLASVRVLVTWPAGWGRSLTVPLALVLCFMQYAAWVNLP